MTSYLSTLNSLLSTTTSRYNSIRRNILTNSSEDDTNIDHPDATHVSRVLRAYYTESHRPLPAWLPPDPYKPPPSANAPTPFVASRPLNSLRSRTNDSQASQSNSNPYGTSSGGGRAGGGGLGDIWDSAPTPPAKEETSLRRAAASNTRRVGMGNQGGGEGGLGDAGGGGGGYSARPLPSQRAGSYQNAGAVGGGGGGGGGNRYGLGGGGGGGGSGGYREEDRPSSSNSGRDRLKARMGSQRGQGGYSGGGGGPGSSATEGLGGWQGRR